MTIETKQYENGTIDFCMTDKAYGPEQEDGFRLSHVMWFRKNEGEWIHTGIRSHHQVIQLFENCFYVEQAWNKIIDPVNW